MIHISRNYDFDSNENKAFEIYSDSTLEHLEFTCNYHDMLKVMQDNIDIMLENEMIDYQEAWLIKDDYIAYDELVYSLENENC